MIKTFYQIGQIVKDDYPEYFEPWSNPFPLLNNANVIVINLVNGKIQENIEIEAFSKNKIDKYLYREAKARATNLVPTFIFKASSNSEKLKEEIGKQITKIKASIKNYNHRFLSINEVSKISPLLEKLRLDNKTSYILTFKIDGKYLGEFDEYKKLFYSDAFKKYSKDSKANNKLCAVTGDISNEVWGRVNTLGFTVNDKPFSRNGFDQKDSYKMFPVSGEAVKILEGSRKFLFQKFSRNFYGLKYLVLPHFINISDSIQKEVIDYFISIGISNQNTLHNERNAIISKDDYIQEIINEEQLNKNNVYYDIFFYQINQQQFLIKLHLSDVLPSRFRSIFNVKRSLEEKYRKVVRIIYPPKGKGKESEIVDFSINFAEIKDFFSVKIKEKNIEKVIFHPYFFKIIEAVFYGSKLNRNYILKSFMKVIVLAFKSLNEKRYLFPQTVKKSFVIYQFFNQLGLFKNQIIMDNIEKNEAVLLDLNSFIQQHPGFFNSDYKKGVFMMGCLTKILLEKQYKKLKSEPFLKNLNNLSLDENNIQNLLPKLISKLRQYETRLNDIERSIAQALISPCDSIFPKFLYLLTYKALQPSFSYTSLCNYLIISNTVFCRTTIVS